MARDSRSAALQQLRAERAYRFALSTGVWAHEPTAAAARLHLLEFVRWSDTRSEMHSRRDPYTPGWVHGLICEQLEWFAAEVRARRSPRLMIAMPPRSGKSTIVSEHFPTWDLGQSPNHEIVVASYGADLAEQMSRGARSVRDSATALWPHLAPSEQDNISLWRTQGGGSYKPVGAGGPLTGMGAHILIIDDPFKNAEEADSPVIRDSRWEWYRSTAYTRLAPGGGVLVMNTRWHHDDMSGRLLEAQTEGGDEWRVLSFPAIAEEDEHHPRTGELLRRRGDALHPERFDLERLRRIQGALGSRAWVSLYQQRPTPEGGAIFLRAWMQHRYDWHFQSFDFDEIVVSVDATFGKGARAAKASNSYVSIQAWGRKGAKFYLGGEIRQQLSYTEMRHALRDFVMAYNPSAVIIEDQAGGPMLIDELAKEFPMIVPFAPNKHGGKLARANVCTPIWEAGNVRLPDPSVARWIGAWIEEVCSFPVGTHNDRVDAMSQVLIWWTQRDGRKAWAAQAAITAAIARGDAAPVSGPTPMRQDQPAQQSARERRAARLLGD